MNGTAFMSILLLLAVRVGQAQWQPDVRLTEDVAFSSTTFNNARTIAGSTSELHVVWFDERDANREIYHKRTIDGGAHWSADTRLTTNAADSMFPSVAVSGQDVHVVWEEYRDGNAEIYYTRSIDSGVTWSADVRLTNNAATSLSPSLAVVGDVLHVVWFDARAGNHEVFSKRSVNGGVTWEPDVRLTVNAAASIYASVCASGQAVHVVWEEYRNGPNGEIYYKTSTDAGANWGPDVRLTNNPGKSFSPSIVALIDQLHLVWFDTRDGNSEIYEKRSSDAGLNWSADTRLTNNSANSMFPCISAAGPSVHVAWIDERDGNLEIYYKRSVDHGLTWEPAVRLTDNAFRSTDPSVVALGTAVHVVWTDARDGSPGGTYNGNYEIYYKREPTGIPVSADIDGNGVVNIDDLLAVISAWGPCPAPPKPCPADIVQRGGSAGLIDIDDLLAVISAWGGWQ